MKEQSTLVRSMLVTAPVKLASDDR